MPTYTTYIRLEKPDLTEKYDVNVGNKNNDIIDSELHKIENNLGLLASKQELNSAITQSNHYTDDRIADLIGGAPETLDTLKEVADSIAENETVVEALNAAIGTKANQIDLDNHTSNSDIHVTQNDKDIWNDAVLKKHTHDNQTVLDGITFSMVTELNDSIDHVSDSVKHITSEERTAWNATNNHVTSEHAPSDAERNIITGIQRNGVDLSVSENRKVNIDIPTVISSFDNDSGYVSEQKMQEMLSDYSNTQQIQQLIDQFTSGVKIAQNEEGKWGYIPAGADTVIPFSSGGENVDDGSCVNYLKLGTIAHSLPGTLWIEKDDNETMPEQIDTIAVLSTITSESDNTVSCLDGEKYIIGDIFLNTKDTEEIGCCWIE